VIVYVDASAAMKLVVEEQESAALGDHIQQRAEDGDTPTASLLPHTELNCAVNRRPEDIGRNQVAKVLSAIALFDQRERRSDDCAATAGAPAAVCVGTDACGDEAAGSWCRRHESGSTVISPTLVLTRRPCGRAGRGTGSACE